MREENSCIYSINDILVLKSLKMKEMSDLTLIQADFLIYNKELAKYQSFFFPIYFWPDNDTLLVESPNDKVLVDEPNTINTCHA